MDLSQGLALGAGLAVVLLALWRVRPRRGDRQPAVLQQVPLSGGHFLGRSECALERGEDQHLSNRRGGTSAALLGEAE